MSQKDTKVGSQNFGYQILFCARLVIVGLGSELVTVQGYFNDIFKVILVIDGWCISSEIVLNVIVTWWLSQH